MNKFNIIRQKVSEEEKQQRIKDYIEEMEFFGFPVSETELKKLQQQDLYDEKIHLKCLRCGHEGIHDWEFIDEVWSRKSPYPSIYCPKCGKGGFIPIDVYNSKRNK